MLEGRDSSFWLFGDNLEETIDAWDALEIPGRPPRVKKEGFESGQNVRPTFGEGP